MSDERLRKYYRKYTSEPTPQNEALFIREIDRAGLRGDTAEFYLFIIDDHIVTDEDVKGLLCSGIEGGINYWVERMDYDIAPGYEYGDFCEGGSMQGDSYWHPSQIIPTVPGCAVIFHVSDEGDSNDPHAGKDYRLDRPALQRGLETMQQDYSRHWNDFIEGREDAITGDVFIQCCLFGDIIYG